MNDAFHSQIPQHVQLDEVEPLTAATITRRLTFRRIVLIAVGLMALLCGIAFVVQPLLKPEIDPTLTVPVAVESTEQPVDELAGIPLDCITRSITQDCIDCADHPLLPLLEVARDGVQFMDDNVEDYECTIVSQARVNGVLGDERYMHCKVRHKRKIGNKYVPLSIYTRFLKPENVAGQEAIWVEGRNRGKIIAHGSGLLNIKRLYLNPDGALAMNGNRYSMPNLGMKNLTKKLIEKGINDLNHEECIATIKRGVDVDGHTCTLMEIKHPHPREHFEFHIARIYIDDHRNLPIAYEGYLWPENPGDPPPLLEKYYYTDIKINKGLKSRDFHPKNTEYDFPRW